MHFGEYSIRASIKTDASEILSLYKKVAQLTPGGLVRTPEEITQDYVNTFLSKTLDHGLGFVVTNTEHKIIAEIHTYSLGIKAFNHVWGDLTICVDPDYQNKKIGSTLFGYLLDQITQKYTHILKVCIVVRSTNQRARHVYEKLGFIQEGLFARQIRDQQTGQFIDDIPFAWFNPGYQKD
ncbi:MAG: Acetyltransferase family protein [candidate division TM6 bacterium GW2011_GWE2_41_16]|nr:MAG: Acetyltransferase family protein [candidate division TM6 bacterium GW2011_GWE2_41_16]